MAGTGRLSGRAGKRWLGLLALVLLLHVVALDWLGRHLVPAGLLRPMSEPLFTRVLQQEAPAPVAAAVATPTEATAPPRPAIRAVEKQAPRPRPAASEPAPPAPEDTPPPPEQVAQAPSPPVAEPAPAPPASPAASAPASPAEPADAAAPGSGLDGWPGDTRLNYRLGGFYRSGELHGNARVQWLRQGDRYETRVDIDIYLLVSLALTSQGQVTPTSLKPEVYQELRRNGTRTARLREDSILLGNGKTVPRPPGVQDTASQFVELSHRFASGLDPLEVGHSVTLWMARPGGVDRWTYDIAGREILQTPNLGAVEAFHLKPRPIDNPRGNITAEIWFAPSLQYLPVRIRVNMGETYVDLIVDTIEQR